MGIGRVILTGNREAELFLASLGGADSPELREAAKALAQGIRSTIRPKSTQVSAPGDPPISKSGRLRRSIKFGRVGTGQRVAVTAFYAPFQQFGLDPSNRQTTPPSRRDLFTGAAKLVKGASVKAFARRLRRRDSTGRLGHLLRARPFMEAGLQRSQDEMTGVVVSTIQRRTPST